MNSEQLFNRHPEGKVCARDLYGNVLERDLENFRFRISVYGILRSGNQILMQRHPSLKTYGLPGGGVEINESIHKALLREFKDETGLKIRMKRLLTVTEAWFTYDEEDAHSILICYEVEEQGGKLQKWGNQSDTSEVKFVNLHRLNKSNVQWVFWPIIKSLKRGI